MSDTFHAIVAEEIEGKVRTSLKELSSDDLPPGDVTVRVA
jgi:hypothetical protein